MKFRITMKDPDSQYDAVQEAAEEVVRSDPGFASLLKEEREMVIEARKTTLAKFADQWMEYGEYVTLEFDTEANTCVVVKEKS